MYRTAFGLFLAPLFFAPLAFGTVELWSMSVVQLLICVAALCYLFAQKQRGAVLLQVPGMLPLILLVLFMLLQLVPLPEMVTTVMSPSAHDIYAPLQDVSERYGWIPLTVNQKATLFEAMRIASYLLFYFLTVQILSNGKLLKKTTSIVAYLAIGIAFLALIQEFTSPDRIYWFRATPSNAGTMGPWVYHNHYAGFMGMMAPVVLALFLFYRPSVDDAKPLRSRMAAVFSMPGSNIHFFMGFGAIIIISSIFVSLSRGGVVSLSLALVLFLAMLPRKTFGSRLAAYGILATCVALLGTWLGWEALLDKFGSTFTQEGTIYDVRLTLWEDSVRIIRDFFLTGAGFGTFIHIYPLYSTVKTDYILHHAHNDYFELFTDGGIIGFVLAAWFVLAVVVHGWRRIRLRHDRYAILLGIGTLTGIVAILFHSVTDFNMHNGANGLYFFFLCGLLVSAGNTRIYYRTRPTLLNKARPVTWQAATAFALVLFCAGFWFRGGALIAGSRYAEVADIYLSKMLNQEKVRQVADTALAASRYDQLEGKYSFAHGNALVFLNDQETAMRSYIQAVRKDPLAGLYLQRIALLLTTVDKVKAERLMATAYERALSKDPLILTWVQWLLSMGERQKAVQALSSAFAGNPALARKFLSAISVYAFKRQEMVTILPDSVEAWIAYGGLSEKRGQLEDAEYFRTGALAYLEMEEQVKPWYFSQLYWFYYRQKRHEEAVNLLRQASERLPEHAEFHVLLGDHYRREGILYRARQEYEQALLLEPADIKTREKLEELQKN